jgi:phosphoribosylformylglycinamidine synthase
VLLLIGAERGVLGQSLYQEHAIGRFEGAPPPVDLAAERITGDLVRGLIIEGAVHAVHDLSDGGLATAVAEMALAAGIGVELAPYAGELPLHAVYFGEDQGRYLVATSDDMAFAVEREAQEYGLPVRQIGVVRGENIVVPGETPLPLSQLRSAHERWLPDFMTSV